MKHPDLLWYVLEVLGFVDVDIARRSLLVSHELGKALLQDVVSHHGIAGDKPAKIWTLQQVQRHQLLSQDAQLPE